jgi:hemolysin
MKRKYLCLALSAASLSSFAHERPPTAGSAAASEPLLLHVSDLATALLSPEGLAQPGTKSDRLPGPHVLWVRRADLDRADVRNQAVAAMADGRAVLVTGAEGVSDGETRTFGYRTPAMAAIYARSEDGTLETSSVAEGIAPVPASEELAAWVFKRIPAPSARTLGAYAAVRESPTDAGYLPRTVVRTSKSFGTRGIRQEIVVVRDVTASRDEKVIMVTTEVDQTASFTGTANGTLEHDVEDYGSLAEALLTLRKTHGVGFPLWVPDRYVVTMQLEAAGEPADITIDSFTPGTAPPTDRLITGTSSFSTSKSFNVQTDALLALARGEVSAAGRLPYTYDGTREWKEESSVSMNVQDYWLVSNTRQGTAGHAVDWVYSLAGDIASNPHYFEKGKYRGKTANNTALMTPMMRAATLKSVAVWRVPGNYEGKLHVITNSSSLTRKYHSLSGSSSVMDDPGADIAFTSEIDLGSPFLTRQPTVQLQSLSGTGRCLSLRDSAQDDLVLADCDTSVNAKEQQWNLEVDNTFRSRVTGRCLAADPVSGRVHAPLCKGIPLYYQWAWSYDRIRSLFHSGGMWRLHVHDGMPAAMADSRVHDPVVTNINAMLPPWSSYPLAPQAGDTVPSLTNDTPPPVPAAWLSFKSVTTSERWKTVPVRADTHGMNQSR